MLTALRVRNFRLLRDVQLKFEPGVPLVVIGPNSSGKSTLIEVVDFLATAVTKGLQHAAFRDRHGPADFLSAGAGVSDSMLIEVTLSGGAGFANEPDGGAVSYACELSSQAGYLRVDRESLSIHKRGPDEPPLKVLHRKGESCRLLNAHTHQWDEVEVEAGVFALGTIEQRSSYPTLSNTRKAFSTVSSYPGFLALPSWARDPREAAVSPRESAQLVPVERLDRRGLDLINALYSLQSFHPERWAGLEHHFKQEFPFVERMTFPPDPGGSRLALAWTDRRFPSTQLRAHQMSSGMIHFLSLLAAAMTPDQPMLLAFDEPEVHLHPSAIRRWVHILEQVSDHTAVLVVTHSSQLLEYLRDPAASVLTCEPSRTGAKLETLDRDALDAWLEDYSLAELRSRGFVDTGNSVELETA